MIERIISLACSPVFDPEEDMYEYVEQVLDAGEEAAKALLISASSKVTERSQSRTFVPKAQQAMYLNASLAAHEKDLESGEASSSVVEALPHLGGYYQEDDDIANLLNIIEAVLEDERYQHLKPQEVVSLLWKLNTYPDRSIVEQAAELLRRIA